MQQSKPALLQAIPEAVKHFDQLSPECQVRLPVVKIILGISDATAWRMVAVKKITAHRLTQRTITFTDISKQNQRLKLLDWLLEKNNITTTQVRNNLDIMSPAARIKELKRHGYLINTMPADWTSEHGINHKGVARYVITQKQPVETIKKVLDITSYLIALIRFVLPLVHAVDYFLPYFNEAELIGVINFLSQFV